MTNTRNSRFGIAKDAVIAILVVVILSAILGLLLWGKHLNRKPYEVSAMFHVQSVPPRVLDDEQEFDEQELETYKSTQLAYLKSFFVFESALRQPGIASLSVLAPHDDNVDWVRNNLEASFDGESELLSIKMRGTEAESEDLRKIVDAISDAYLNTVVFEETQRRRTVRDLQYNSLNKLREKVERLIDERIGLENELKGQASVKLELLKADLEVQNELLRTLSLQVEKSDLESQVPERIRQVQKATLINLDDPPPGQAVDDAK